MQKKYIRVKLKCCLIILLIVATSFCLLNTSITNNSLLVKFLMPSSHAEGVDKEDFIKQMLDTAKKIANDDYISTVRLRNERYELMLKNEKIGTAYNHTPNTGGESKTTNKYAYYWMGAYVSVVGETGIEMNDGTFYATLDCAEFVAAAIKYAAIDSGETDSLRTVTLDTGAMETELIKRGFSSYFMPNDVSQLRDGDILWRKGHTEIFFKEGSMPRQVGAHDNPIEWGRSDYTLETSISECGFTGISSWTGYFRFDGLGNKVGLTGTITEDPDEPQLENWKLEYSGDNYDTSANLDEQIFDFQGNPQIMVFEGDAKTSFWLFEFLSSIIDFITGLLVSLLINPIMALLNAIVNFLVNFINYISGTKLEDT